MCVLLYCDWARVCVGGGVHNNVGNLHEAVWRVQAV